MAIDHNLLLKIKNYLRRRHSELDDDLSDSITACLKDLEVYGIRVPAPDDPDELDPLILQAVKLYCKAEDVDDPAKAAEFRARYESLKACLGMAGEYREGAGDE